MAAVEKQEPEKAAPLAAEEPKKEEEVKEEPKGMPFTKQFFIYFRLLFAANPTWFDYVLVIFGTITAIGAGVPFPLMGIIFGQLVDNMNAATCAADGNTGVDAFAYESAINQKVIQTAYVGAIALVLIYSYILSWSIISQRLAQRLRTQYVSALLRQPPSYFDKRAAAGEVSSRLHGDITAIQSGTSEKVGIVICSLSFFVTVFIIAFTKQPKLAGMLVSMLPAFMLSSFVGGGYITRNAGRMTEAIGKASSIASEALSHISVVQAFGAGPRLEAKFADHMITARKAGMKKAAAAAVQAGLLYFIAYAGNALAFWQGSIRIADSMAGRGDGATVGEIYAVVYLLVDACIMLGSIAPILPLLGGASAAYQRLWEDIEAPSEIDGTSEEGKVLPLDDPKGIVLRNVTFEYPARPGQPVLRNVNLEFPAGKYTAVVGLSGSGKSTIAALIARLQDPNQGEILLDGHDIRELNVRSLRSFISFVQQEPSLLDRSILENIALGLINSPKPEHQRLRPYLSGGQLAELASKGKDALSSVNNYGPEIQEIVDLVRHAAEQADAATFINRLDDGYGTSAGPSGTLVSGGQRQRIALARALIRDPKILVLDEATSALDSASEKRIQRAVEQAATENRTIVSIAHRLSTIRNADNIVVMEAGQVVEQGTYTDLMAREDGAFARMARLQTLGTADRTVFAICVNVLVAVILSHIIAWKIALVCLVTIPILLGSGFMQLRMLARYEERHSAAFSTATSVATEAVQSIKTVAALSLESQVMDNYARLLAPPQKQMVRASASTNIWLAISNVTGTFVNALAYWWAHYERRIHPDPVPDHLGGDAYQRPAVGYHVFSGPEFSRARSALSRIMTVINLGKNDDLSKTGTQPKQIVGDSKAEEDVEATGEVKAKRPNAGGVKVTFKNVSFAYPSRPDVNILDNVSFTLQPGQFCGLVGPSGAGKSTIMNLVQRLYFPSQGQVLIDGHDIANLPTSFRDTVAIVPQDPTLFDGSVRFNVGLGSAPDTEATQAEIEEACKLANIHDVIMALPDGYETECGPSASRLSGGQRQRLAIARALVRKPRLLLLDESTSALDAASEAALQEGLERASRGTTVLAITHRLHTVHKANVILLVEGGQIADSGTHQELMERRESYRINAMQQMLQ
ncbi:LOW QUALITY PROTEIN: ABC multidrug transporter [Colletotrichum tofieldiae]|nr:LOW QUALITY PROTEIN: ABC multidrug transporter [Colletotrichum tofieldiae]